MHLKLARAAGLILVVLIFATQLSASDRNLDDFRNPRGKWRIVGDVRISANEPAQLSFVPGEGILTNGSAGKTTNRLTKSEHGDVEVYVPKNSNSGVYLQGRYEVPIRDSHQVPTPTYADMGGPLMLQGDHGPVAFRNLEILEILEIRP